MTKGKIKDYRLQTIWTTGFRTNKDKLSIEEEQWQEKKEREGQTGKHTNSKVNIFISGHDSKLTRTNFSYKQNNLQTSKDRKGQIGKHTNKFKKTRINCL